MKSPFPIPYHWTLRTWVGRHAGLFAAIYRLGNRGEDRLCGPGMDFVIDGFPRSGNSFAHYALLHCGRRDMRIAHHVHAPAQIIIAARLGIPALVVLREPAEAVAGALVKNPRFRAADLLCAYRLYYASLLPLAAHFVVSPFEVAIEDFGAIIARLNARFGTDFAPLDRDRQAAITPAFLALERRFQHPVPRADPEAEIAAHPRLLEQARATHARFRALAPPPAAAADLGTEGEGA